MYMRFEISDHEYFKNKWREEGVPENNIKNILASFSSEWTATISMVGKKGKHPNHIKIVDSSGKRLKMPKIGSFEKSIVDSCIKYFKNPSWFDGMPLGVVGLNYAKKAG